MSVEDESYSRATLGVNQGKATEAEQKVLGVCLECSKRLSCV